MVTGDYLSKPLRESLARAGVLIRACRGLARAGVYIRAWEEAAFPRAGFLGQGLEGASLERRISSGLWKASLELRFRSVYTAECLHIAGM